MNSVRFYLTVRDMACMRQVRQSILQLVDNVIVLYSHVLKGRFLEFQRCHNLFSKLSESTFYKEISKFQ